jgi:tetratricopeptide (TPR) repeat protein
MTFKLKLFKFPKGVIIKSLLVLILPTGATVPNVYAASVNPSPPSIESLQDVDALIQTALELYQKRQFSDALAQCANAKALSPDDFRAYAIAGLVWMAQWKMDNASQEFATAIRLQPQNKELYVFKARADANRGKTDEAIAAARKALEIDPNHAEAFAALGEALQMKSKREAEAIAAYQSALKLNPQLVDVYDSLGQIYLDVKDVKKAEEIFRQGMAADPQRMSGRFNLGRLLVDQGRLTEARQLWEERTSDEDRVRPTFITLLTRAENLKKASEALAQKPKDPEALVAMGLAVMDGDSWVIDDRQNRAIVYFRKALALQPGSSDLPCFRAA